MILHNPSPAVPAPHTSPVAAGRATCAADTYGHAGRPGLPRVDVHTGGALGREGNPATCHYLTHEAHNKLWHIAHDNGLKAPPRSTSPGKSEDDPEDAQGDNDPNDTDNMALTNGTYLHEPSARHASTGVQPRDERRTQFRPAFSTR